MKLGWEATGSGVMCEGSPYRSHQYLSKRGSNQSTRDSVCDFVCNVGELFDQGPEHRVGVELAWQVHVLEARSLSFFYN